MATIHFLNVKDGDCSVIRHNSGRVSVIDVCNAKALTATEMLANAITRAISGQGGNFNQKAYPVNPISYLKDHSVDSVHRYIQTHPDMDHMDGIQALFAEFSPLNMWDTRNTKEMPSSSWSSSPYNRDDWEFYRRTRDSDPSSDPKRLTLVSGDTGQYWNHKDGDGLSILAPTAALVASANATGDYNRCSYVVLYRTNGKKVVFGGDSHDDTWEHILSEHGDAVTNVDLLIAPHHGRSSGRSYAFLARIHRRRAREQLRLGVPL